MGYASYQLKEYRLALRTFERVLGAQPRDGDARFMWSMAHAQLGHHRRALAGFRRGLVLGLKSESPKEARRYIRTLGRLLKSRLRSGWLFHVALAVGYDSHPRLAGGAAAASTSDGSTGQGSGFARTDLRLGYRWLPKLRLPKGLRSAFAVGYRFDQLLVFNDFIRTAGGQGHWRGTEDVSGLSLQTHELHSGMKLLGRKWSLSVRLAGSLELAGLRDMAPLIAGLSLELNASAAWHAFTSTHLHAGYSPQWALSPPMDYLTGHGMYVGFGQRLTIAKRFRADLTYHFGAWWLGTLETPVSDCIGGEPCGVVVPFGNHSHRPGLRFRLRATRWLQLRAHASVELRTFRGTAEYQLAGGGFTTVQRIDLTQRYGVSARTRLVKNIFFTVGYAYTYNRSTVDTQSVGIEEGYQRHQVWAGLRYRRW